MNIVDTGGREVQSLHSEPAHSLMGCHAAHVASSIPVAPILEVVQLVLPMLLTNPARRQDDKFPRSTAEW